MAKEFSGDLEDLQRIQRVVASKGWLMTFEEANNIWQEFSLDCDAGWLILPESDGGLWEIISDRMTCEADELLPDGEGQDE